MIQNRLKGQPPRFSNTESAYESGAAGEMADRRVAGIWKRLVPLARIRLSPRVGSLRSRLQPQSQSAPRVTDPRWKGRPAAERLSSFTSRLEGSRERLGELGESWNRREGHLGMTFSRFSRSPDGMPLRVLYNPTYFFENVIRVPNFRPTPFEKPPKLSLARLF